MVNDGCAGVMMRPAAAALHCHPPGHERTADDSRLTPLQVRSGEAVENHEILRFAQLFSDDITLDTLERLQLVRARVQAGTVLQLAGCVHTGYVLTSKIIFARMNPTQYAKQDGTEVGGCAEPNECTAPWHACFFSKQGCRCAGFCAADVCPCMVSVCVQVGMCQFVGLSVFGSDQYLRQKLRQHLLKVKQQIRIRTMSGIERKCRGLHRTRNTQANRHVDAARHCLLHGLQHMPSTLIPAVPL